VIYELEISGRIQQQARRQVKRAEFTLVSGKHAWKSSHGKIVCQYLLVHRALVEGGGAGDGKRSALLRMLRLRHHH